jgi:hypothetical protein
VATTITGMSTLEEDWGKPRRKGSGAGRRTFPAAALACFVFGVALKAAGQAAPPRVRLAHPPDSSAHVPRQAVPDPDLQFFAPPIAGGWDVVESMGQPPLWRPAVGAAFGVDRVDGELRPGPTVSAGVHRSLLNPVTGALGFSFQGYLGQRASVLDGGLRAFLDSPAFFLHLGADWNPRRGDVRPVISTSLPGKRGGWFHRGGLLRVDLVPGSKPSFAAGVWVPVRQPHSGKTRSLSVETSLPAPSPRVSIPGEPPLDPWAREHLAELELSMRWIASLHNMYWLTERTGISRHERVLRSRQILEIFRAELEERRSLMPDRAGYTREVEHYHRVLEGAFRAAMGGAAEAMAARVTEQARAVVLDEVVLPYNATVGQFRSPDTLEGLAGRAVARFRGWLDVDAALPEAVRDEVLRVFQSWLGALERERREQRRWTGDGRMQWIPLALVLRARDHDTRGKVDALVERALDRPFTGGNQIRLLGSLQLQDEFRRSLHDTREYHVLWIHDFRGRNGAGAPDSTAFHLVTEGYLRALAAAVRRFDETGRFPVYMILLDQFFYEENEGRLWMDLLERPLSHELRLGRDHRAMEEAVAVLQDTLRREVASSGRLQAKVAAMGEEWLEGVVKVHVNITNPSDFAFRSRRLLGIPVAGDNLIRDHRKMVIRDVSAARPGEGEVILTGVGVGDHYASATWDDRGLLIRGPAALPARDEARRVLEGNGVPPDRIPPPLRDDRPDPDHGEEVRALEAAGWDARVIQAHNGTGWERKDATFIQMLLYDLLPPGTVIYVPDSLWTSPEWMAQLVSAALRGCTVLIVAPALANAPSAGFPQMSETRELLVALLLVREALGDVIREAGGDLRVGVYARAASLEETPARAAEVLEGFQEHSFLHEIFPLSPEAWEVVEGYAGAGDDRPDLSFVARDVEERVPLLHQKAQFFASSELLATLGTDPDLPRVLARFLALERDEGFGMWSPGIARALPRELQEHAPAYLMVGSLNKNVRSMALDGEVTGVVSGPRALEGYLDFLLLSGSVAWLEAPEDLDPHHPPWSDFRRLLGRFLLRIL